jgi:uncharacterized membrane protein
MRRRRHKQAIHQPEIPFSGGQKAAALLGLFLVMLLLISTSLIYPQLPDQIPTHINLDGQVNDTLGKASLFMIPALSLVLCLFMLKLSKLPKLYNYRIKLPHDVSQQLYILARRLILSLNLVISLLMIYIQLGTILMAKNISKGLSPFILLIFLAFILLSLSIYLKHSRALLPQNIKYSMKGKHLR